MKKNSAIYIIDEEIKKLENNIDYLQKKNFEHQSYLDGNNERIEELKEHLKDFVIARDIITSTFINVP